MVKISASNFSPKCIITCWHMPGRIRLSRTPKTLLKINIYFLSRYMPKSLAYELSGFKVPLNNCRRKLPVAGCLVAYRPFYDRSLVIQFFFLSSRVCMRLVLWFPQKLWCYFQDETSWYFRNLLFFFCFSPSHKTYLEQCIWFQHHKLTLR